MTDRKEKTGIGLAFGAAAGMLLLSLAMLLAWDAGTDVQPDLSPGGVSGLSTMTGVLALDTDRGANGVRAHALKRHADAVATDAGGDAEAPPPIPATASKVARAPTADR